MKNHKKYSEKQKNRALDFWRDEYGYETRYVEDVAKKFKCCVDSLWRWRRKRTDGVSLENIKPTPKRIRNRMLYIERKLIKQIVNKYPDYSIQEIYGILLKSVLPNGKLFNRHYHTVRKYIHKLKPDLTLDTKERRENQKYHTPKMMGIKWQIDVVFVPKNSLMYYKPDNPEKKMYQWSCKEEATGQVFVYGYDRHTAENTRDFIKRAIEFFGYKPHKIQTDNGTEFTAKEVNKMLKKQNVAHQRIKVRTPRHNGKVERFHRECQRLFRTQQFTSLEDFNQKMSAWTKLYNDTPNRMLADENGKYGKTSPNQKFNILLNLYIELLANQPVTKLTIVNNSRKSKAQKKADEKNNKPSKFVTIRWVDRVA